MADEEVNIQSDCLRDLSKAFERLYESDSESKYSYIQYNHRVEPIVLKMRELFKLNGSNDAANLVKYADTIIEKLTRAFIMIYTGRGDEKRVKLFNASCRNAHHLDYIKTERDAGRE